MMSFPFFVQQYLGNDLQISNQIYDFASSAKKM